MLHSVRTPDLGTDEAEVIELLVKVGQNIDVDTPLVLLESAKASMEVPSPVAGIVKEIAVTLGAKISEGVLLLQVETAADIAPVVEEAAQAAPTSNEPEKIEPVKEAVSEPIKVKELPHAPEPMPQVTSSVAERGLLHCGPRLGV